MTGRGENEWEGVKERKEKKGKMGIYPTRN